MQWVESANGLRISVPPAGLWRGSKGILLGPLLWFGFVAFFTVMILLPSTQKAGSLLGIALFLLVFWLVGFGMLAFAANLGRRAAELVVEGNFLRVETKGLFGTKKRSWTRDFLMAIRVDPSNMEINHKPVIELQIYPCTGTKVGLLAGQNENELRWIATRLRQALEVPAR